jgi:hypothetical protein
MVLETFKDSFLMYMFVERGSEPCSLDVKFLRASEEVGAGIMRELTLNFPTVSLTCRPGATSQS